MSLSTQTPDRRRSRSPSKAATRRVKAAPAIRVQQTAPHLLDAERLFRRFEQLLPAGDHAFSQLRQDFDEWCAAGDIAPPSHIKLAAWLTQAGLVSYRAGRAKVTFYAKRAARLAA